MKRLALLACTGCFGYSELPNHRPDPVIRKLADAQILDMKINLHKQMGLCPGHEGKLYANATVQWPGMKPVLRSIGSDVDSLQPGDFAISGPLLTGDANAHLHPDPDVLKSVEAGFDIDVTYKPIPKLRFHENFPPEYSCFTGTFAGGNAGGQGAPGDPGNNGDYGQHGTRGGDGGRGNNGEPGGRITAYVTIVSTKYYPKLYAVIANDQFYLAPPDRQLTFAAPGGAGGQGGPGGNGGNGGDQQTQTYDRRNSDGSTTSVTKGIGRAGDGGTGGSGGPGGTGGPGGVVDVTYDAAFPELREFVATDVSGGEGGEGGPGGAGGNGGGSTATENSQTGGNGDNGGSMGNGGRGGSGRASVRPGNVGGMFRSIRGIQVLGGAPMPSPQRPPHRRPR